MTDGALGRPMMSLSREVVEPGNLLRRTIRPSLECAIFISCGSYPGGGARP